MKKLIVIMGIFLYIGLVRADWPMFRQNPMRTGYSTETGKLTSRNLRWEYTIPGMTGEMKCASPSLADIDGDDTMEIVIAGVTNGVFAFSADSAYAELTPEWTYKPPGSGYVITTPLLFDVNKDGKIEVIFGSFNDSLYALDGKGKFLWSFGTGGPINSSPVAGDIDLDGNIEIAFGSWDSYVYVLDSIGNFKWRYKTGSSVESSPALADINKDSITEIIIGSNDGRLYCLQPTSGTLESLWTYNAGDAIYSTPAIGDLDKDGTLDVVFGCNDAYVYAVNGATHDLLWCFPTAGFIDHQSAGLADIDVDTYLEVIIGSFGGEALYVIDGEIGIEKWSKDSILAASSPAIADIDGDGGLEIVMSVHLLYCYAWNVDETEQWKWRYDDGDQDCPVALGDVDGDGYLEVVGADMRKSKVFVLDWPDSMASVEEKSKSKTQNSKLNVYPNPFTTVVRVQWSGISEKQELRLTICDLSGRVIKSFLINQSTNQPINSITWDRRDKNGNRVPSGIYFCKLTSSGTPELDSGYCAPTICEIKKLIAL